MTSTTTTRRTSRRTTSRRTTVRRTAAAVALLAGVQVAAACGSESADPDSGTRSTQGTIQGVGSADAIERRAHVATVRQGLGSADAIERRLTGVGDCHVSADAAERFGRRTGQAPCGR